MFIRFGIPFGLATSLGLAVRAMDLPLTVTEAGDGKYNCPFYLLQRVIPATNDQICSWLQRMSELYKGELTIDCYS